MILKCRNEQDVMKIKNDIEQKIPGKYKLSLRSLFNPRIKIVGNFKIKNLEETVLYAEDNKYT